MRSTRALGGPVSTSAREPGRLDQRRIALPDVEERDAQRARGRREAHAPTATRAPTAKPGESARERRRRDGAQASRAAAPAISASSSARPGSAPSSHAPRARTQPDVGAERAHRGVEATVAPGATGQSAQAASASHRSGATAGSASRFAGRLATSDVRPKMHERDRRGGERAGERDRERAAEPERHGRALEPRADAGARPWIAATAANESWKPGPMTAHGSSASTAAAASASRCQGSRAEPISQASETSTPVAAARTTDGPPPTIAA